MKIKDKLGILARLGNLANSRDVHLLLARFPNLAPYRNIYLNFTFLIVYAVLDMKKRFKFNLKLTMQNFQIANC
ncbi:hypothetical protein C6501_13975 [Candidatus Poribacteria bacterium]|nr:MAG: hypothetical protein C6501_13975 [Candidatus Poribacteria bacterium]